MAVRSPVHCAQASASCSRRSSPHEPLSFPITSLSNLSSEERDEKTFPSFSRVNAVQHLNDAQPRLSQTLRAKCDGTMQPANARATTLALNSLPLTTLVRSCHRHCRCQTTRNSMFLLHDMPHVNARGGQARSA